MKKGGCIYIITNTHHTTLYTGVTSELYERILKHKNKGYVNSFSSKYSLDKLLYFEVFHSIEEAIMREKQIKAGSRKRKEELIKSMNPEWNDLFELVKEREF